LHARIDVLHARICGIGLWGAVLNHGLEAHRDKAASASWRFELDWRRGPDPDSLLQHGRRAEADILHAHGLVLRTTATLSPTAEHYSG
jgi:hypothetical protein